MEGRDVLAAGECTAADKCDAVRQCGLRQGSLVGEGMAADAGDALRDRHGGFPVRCHDQRTVDDNIRILCTLFLQPLCSVKCRPVNIGDTGWKYDFGKVFTVGECTLSDACDRVRDMNAADIGASFERIFSDPGD